MSAAAVDLAAAGYTEREFYADGLASRYAGAVPTSLETARVIDDGWRYRTRVIVRTPDARQFNGSLVVEWANVTLGLDGEFVFNEAHEHLLREGYAVAVVSAQRAGVERLKTWSPERYGDLSVDVNDCGASGTGLCADDPLSFDILAQVSKALKNNRGHGRPLPGLHVDNVIATGQSQSASRLTTYYNTIQPLHGFFDGFVYWDRSGQLRPDLAVPAVSVNSEAFAQARGPVTTAEYTRAWDVAGTTFTWAGSGTDSSEEVPVGDGAYWIDFSLGERRVETLTVAVHPERGWALVVHSRIHDEGTDVETRVMQSFHGARVDGAPGSAEVPAPTRDLIGRRTLFRYSPNHLYEHIYLSSRRFVWQNLVGEQRGHAAAELATTYKLDDGLYLFTWREEKIPVGTVFVFDYASGRSTGKFIGLESDGTISNTPGGALIIPFGALDYSEHQDPV